MDEFVPRSEQSLQPDQKNGKKKILDWAKAILLALILAVLIRMFVFEPFNVSGPSMQDTLFTGDLVMVDKLIYDFREPHRGEVVVFHAPEQQDFIKRVIALPGETIEAKNNKIFINGKMINEPYISEDNRTLDFDQVKVPPGDVFVMGDNRINSKDSRDIGPVPISKIVGRAEFVYYPFDHIQFLW
ncbi:MULTISPECIES: signal peptidase I [unclassified Thermoactinomyces]|nr:MULTISPECIES: signal peptidase I [unclassified Thermoactinomyces]MBH8598166.1 signal peptidase I [Thermoactinomyces sp. CICC 10523]MBH8603197.1 signal peptidase I [Thermoactinomyces sp. CICC 10522]MBH8606996.1 signal peptidase I [Thermoactinomyces sp. CICC 10521]